MRLTFFTSADGDPLKLVERRTLAFGSRKIICGSTPILAETSYATQLYKLSDKRLFEVLWPECGVIADPATIDGLEYADLAGAQGPQTETKAGFAVDGVQVKVGLDFGAGVVDLHGWYLNAGAPSGSP